MADRDQLPDDGHRYELVDGILLVNAAPVTGREPWTAERPFPVTITPADLLG